MTDNTPRERRAERTRKAILDTTMQLIVERGPDKLSLREVARRMDYSPAGLYEYFGSKDELVEAACGEADIRLQRYLYAVPDDLPITEFLVEVGLAYVRFARENPEHFMFLFSHREASFEHLFPTGVNDFVLNEEWAQNDPNFGLLYRSVRHAIDEGTFVTRRGFGTIEIAYAVWSLAHGMASLQAKYLGKLPVNFLIADRHAMEAIIEGLGQPSEPD